MLSAVILWNINGMKNIRISCARRLKIWQWMIWAIQWFPRLRSDIFRGSSAVELLQRRYYCQRRSICCKIYLLSTKWNISLICRRKIQKWIVWDIQWLPRLLSGMFWSSIVEKVLQTRYYCLQNQFSVNHTFCQIL